MYIHFEKERLKQPTKKKKDLFSIHLKNDTLFTAFKRITDGNRKEPRFCTWD